MRIVLNDIEGVQEMLATLATENPKAAVRAINDASKGAIVLMTSEVRRVYNIKQGAIKSKMEVRKRATQRDMSSLITSTGRKTNLFDFVGTKKDKTSGISYKIKKGGGISTLKRAFFGKGPRSGKKIVMHRVKDSSRGSGLARRKAEAKQGLDVETMINSQEIHVEIRSGLYERAIKDIERAIDIVIHAKFARRSNT